MVRLLVDDQIADTSAVTVNENAKLWLNTHDDTLGSLTMRGGLANTGLGNNSTTPGTLSLNGNITNQVSQLAGYNGKISGLLGLGLLSRTFEVEAGSQLEIDANISGSVAPFNSGFTLTGGGTLLLYNATNTYSGTTTTQAGTLLLVGSTPLLGSTNGGTVVNANGLLFLEGVTNCYEPLALNGWGTSVVRWQQGNVWLGPITLNGDCCFDSSSTNYLDQLNLKCVVSGSGSLHKTGSGGTIRFSGAAANTFSGGIFHDGGTLVAEKTSGTPGLAGPLVVGLANETNSSAWFDILGNEQIPESIPLKVLQSGKLKIASGYAETLGHLEMAGGRLSATEAGVVNGIPFDAGTFTLSGNVTNRSIATPGGSYVSAVMEGPITLSSGTHILHAENASSITVWATLQGSGAITKTGPGYLDFQEANTYSGQTVIAGGALVLHSGALPGSIDNNTVVGPGGTLAFSTAAVTNEALVVQADGTVRWGNGFTSRWKGPVTVESNTFFYADGNYQLILEVSVSGAGGITLPDYNKGTLVFSGGADNTFAGPVIVANGTLALQKTAAYAIPGDLVAGSTNLALLAVVNCYRANQFAPATGSQLLTRTVTINPTAFFNFNGYDQTFANLTLTEVTLDTGTATLSLNRNLTVQAFAEFQNMYLVGKLALANAEGVSNHVVSIFNPTSAFLLPARITESAGPANLQKTGFGGFVLSGSNSFSGTFTVSQGLTIAFGVQPLGTLAAATYLESGATLELEGGTNAEAIFLADQSTLAVWETNVQTGVLTLNGNASIKTPTGAMLTVESAITGTGDLTKTGVGRLRFAGNNPNLYSGTTHLVGGFLDLAKTSSNAIPQNLIVGEPAGFVQWLGNNQMANGGALIVTNSGGAYLNGFSDTIGSLAGNQFVFLDTGELTVGANDASTTYSGLLSGTGGKLTKIGAGTLTLTANNPHTGTTTVSGGTLLVMGQQPQSPVTVQTGGKLGGNGRVGNLSDLNGNVPPGASPGILTCSNYATFTPANLLQIEIAGATPGSGYDQLQVHGTVLLMGGTLQVAMSYSGAISNQYVIVSNDGADAVRGTFTGLPEGAMLTNNGVAFQINYHGGDGNDVVLIQKSLSAPPVIGSVKLVAGAIQLTGTGQPNVSYTVQATDSLSPPTPWQSIGSATVNSAGVIQFIDPDAPQHAMRFYRFSLP